MPRVRLRRGKALGDTASEPQVTISVKKESFLIRNSLGIFIPDRGIPLPSLKRFPFGCGFVGAAGRGVVSVYPRAKTTYKPDCPLGVCTTRTAGTRQVAWRIQCVRALLLSAAGRSALIFYPSTLFRLIVCCIVSMTLIASVVNEL